MGTVSRVHTFASGAILTAAQLNNEFDNLLTSSAINGGLDATNLGVTAGQATASKALVVDASRNLADATGSNRINNLALSGTFESTGAITASAGITSGGNIVSDTDSTDDLGTTGVRWRNLYVDDVTVTNNVSIGGTLTLTGGLTLNGNVAIGDSASDTLTVNSTITSNLIFTDNTYDIGASGATRPRDLHLSRNALMGGTLGVTGLITATGGVSGALTGNVTGNVTGDVTGDVTGNISGNVTGGTISGTTGTFSGDLAVDTDTLFVDASADRVGINTSSPSAALSVQYNPATTNGFELIDSRDTNDRVGFLASGGGLGIYTSTNGSYSSSNAAITVDTSQRVGIGTGSPNRDLEIAGTGTDVGLNITKNTVGTARFAYDSIGPYILDEDSNPFRIYTGGGEAIRIDSSQRVGIGTSSPSALLHLYKNGSTQAGLIETDQSASVINFKSTGQTAGQPQVGCSGSNLILNTNGTERARIDASGDLLVLGGTIRTKNATNTQQYGAIYGSASEFSVNAGVNELGLYSAGAKAVTIDSSQNVGIGTASPEAPLEVIADSSQGYAVFLEAAASGTEGAALRGKGTYSIADAGTQTFTVSNGAIVMISENNTGDGAMFFCGYKSATVTLVADPNSRYANTVTAGRISLTKSAGSGTVTLTNNSGGTKSFTILKIMCSD